MLIGIIGLLLFFLTPFLVGTVCIKYLRILRTEGLCAVYLVGLIAMLGFFELLCVPMAFLKGSLSTLTWIYGGALVVVCLYAVVSGRKELRIRWNRTKQDLKGMVSIAFFLALALIAFQTFVSVYYTTYAGLDDAGYIVYSLDAVSTDQIYGCSPYTGNTAFNEYKMLFTSWCIFISFLSRISGVHVAAVAHTVLPFILVPVAYGTLYLLGKRMSRGRLKSAAFFSLFINIIMIFSGYSFYSMTLRLNVCIWHGKAILAVIILPFLFYFLSMQKEFGWIEYGFLILIFLAGNSMSLMASGLILVMFLTMFCVNYRFKLNKSSILMTIFLLLLITAFSLAYLNHYSFGRFFAWEEIVKGITQAYDNVFKSFALYWNKSWMLWITLACFIYLCFRKTTDIAKNLLVRYTVVCLILMYNPVFVYVAYVYLKGANSFVRVYYLLPIIYVTAYAFTDAVMRFRRKWTAYIAGAVLSGGVMLAGSTFYSETYFQATENIYKIPQEVLDIIGAMQGYDDDIYLIGPNQILPFLRQYDSNVYLLYGRNGAGKTDGGELMISFDSGTWSAESIRASMVGHTCRFVIFYAGDGRTQQMLDMGGSLIARTQQYEVIYFAE